MPFTPWTPVIVTIVLGIMGLAIQGLLLAYFLGRMKEHQAGQAALVQAFQRFTEGALGALTERMSRMDSFTAESQAHRSELAARLSALELSVKGLPEFRESFAGFRAKTEGHQKRVEADLDRLNHSSDALQRQLAQLAINGPGRLVQLGQGAP